MSVGVLVCFCGSFVIFGCLCDFLLVGILLTRRPQGVNLGNVRSGARTVVAVSLFGVFRR